MRAAAHSPGRSTAAQSLLAIESEPKRRIADEYDAAQERGEVAGPRDGTRTGVPDGNARPTVAEIGLTSKQIHEARQIRGRGKVELQRAGSQTKPDPACP